MKLCLVSSVLVLLAVGYADGNDCSISQFTVFNPADPGPYVPCLQDPCADDSEDVALVNCTLHSHCAIYNNKCYAKRRPSVQIDSQQAFFEVIAGQSNAGAPNTTDEDARLFPIGGGLPSQGGLPTPPGGLFPTAPTIPGCNPGTGGLGVLGGLGALGGLGGLPTLGPVIPNPGFPFPTICPSSFPATCGINAQSNLIQLLQPPVNVPYCQRIPCSSSNPCLESNRFSCMSLPGCYFDLGLANLRRQYGNHIMPGVPVCHLAIRNRKFHTIASNYVRRSGRQWNGIYTRCLLNENRNEVFSPAAGCYQINVLKYIGVFPKIAGWPGITTQECYLIDGCPIDGGCYHPGDLSRVQVRSGEDATRRNVQTGYNYYGQPMCMNYNPTTPQQYLTGYHQCRQAGCVVDPSISNQLIRQQFYQLATTLPLLHQRPFWNGVLNNQIRPDNYQQHLTPSACPNVGSNPTPSLLPFSLNLSGRKKRNANLGFGPGIFPTPVPQCPYQTYNGQLTGSTAGCCQRNYCYTPRSTILRSASGIATYQGNWGEYEACSVSCGGGTRKRTRPCIRYHANDTCEHESEQIHRCNVDACPNFGSWTPYGQCSSTCGAGTRTRSRPCLPAGSTCADDIQGGATQSQPCNNGACPVYSNWSPYGACNAVCGVGQQTRSRTCTAATGGAPCSLPLVDTKSCAVSCGSCQDVRGPCQRYNKCYRVITTQCVPDASGGAYCPDCVTPTTRKERCTPQSPQGNDFLCGYCAYPQVPCAPLV